jgi:AcrR family transcriptional regulator
VVLDNPDVVRTFLNEARMLDEDHRSRVIAARDRYEQSFREVIASGVAEGSFRPDTDPKIASIFILSILNAIERWYRPDGAIGRDELVDRLSDFALSGLVQ